MLGAYKRIGMCRGWTLTPNIGGDVKSHESDQVRLAVNIYKDAIAKCIAVKPDLRDLMTIKSRVEQEGISFLTITLPQYGKDFEKSLSEGYIDSTSFQGFRKFHAIPAFLQGMLSQLFNEVTGKLREHTDEHIPVIEGVRQIAYSFKKLELPCTPERVRATLRNFVSLEADLKEVTISDSDISSFVEICDVLWSDLFRDFDIHELRPRHGPGATAERISGNQKFVWQRWHERLEPYFPLIDTAYPIGVVGSETRELENVSFITEELEQPVRVTPVPKTQKGPRIIAIEPCCMQYAQQALRAYLYDKLERASLTAGHINFSDQSVNRRIAMDSSADGSMATLDLSDASDRVLYAVAIRMFDSNPDLQDAIIACRSTRAEMPDGQVIGPLAKFASMGSALCFPVESMYFYTICIGALLKEQSLPVTRRNMMFVSRSVYIYGDDIIVPSRFAIAVIDNLQKYYCKVNATKSFSHGLFRESCGMDAYAGYEVTPTYIRRMHPNDRREADTLVSWVKTANLFYKRGYWSTSSYMFDICERYLGRIPYLAENSPGLGRISFRQFRTIGRWNRSLQRLEVKAWVASPVYQNDKLEGYAAIQKSLSMLDGRHNDDYLDVDKEHMDRSARHGAVTLKRRWIPVD